MNPTDPGFLARCARISTFTLMGMLLVTSVAYAQGAGISVSPTRLELDARTKSAELNVINRGTETRTYRISLKHMQMTEDGRLQKVEKADAGKVADDFVRFSPRQIELAPGVMQKVRVLARVPADAESGEYRSHLHFEALPLPEAPTPAQKSEKLELKLQVIGAVSIPLIVRHGQPSVAVKVSSPQIEQTASGEYWVSFGLLREGARSAYGDVEVVRLEPGKKPTPIGILKGVAVYPEVGRRQVKLQVHPSPGMPLAGQSLEVRFIESLERGGRPIATGRFTAP